MASNKDVAIRKRQQIDSSKRTMFIAVAIVAFASGIALVVSYFFVKQILFHSEVISQKQSTIGTIRANVVATEELKDNVRVLDANQALNSVKINEDSSALQTILDALPAEANADALGASLQIRFAGAVDGITVENLSVEPVVSMVDDGLVDTGDAEVAEGDEVATHGINFSMRVTGSADALKELLTRFERSIRVVDLVAVEIKHHRLPQFGFFVIQEDISPHHPSYIRAENGLAQQTEFVPDLV
mgnify:CR=1 FL=1